MEKRLYRSSDKVLGGVCAGIAEYVGADPTIIRLLWIVLTLMWGAGIVLYVFAWIIMPVRPAMVAAPVVKRKKRR